MYFLKVNLFFLSFYSCNWHHPLGQLQNMQEFRWKSGPCHSKRTTADRSSTKYLCTSAPWQYANRVSIVSTAAPKHGSRFSVSHLYIYTFKFLDSWKQQLVRWKERLLFLRLSKADTNHRSLIVGFLCPLPKYKCFLPKVP